MKTVNAKNEKRRQDEENNKPSKEPYVDDFPLLKRFFKESQYKKES